MQNSVWCGCQVTWCPSPLLQFLQLLPPGWNIQNILHSNLQQTWLLKNRKKFSWWVKNMGSKVSISKKHFQLYPCFLFIMQKQCYRYILWHLAHAWIICIKFVDEVLLSFLSILNLVFLCLFKNGICYFVSFLTKMLPSNFVYYMFNEHCSYSS